MFFKNKKNKNHNQETDYGSTQLSVSFKNNLLKNIQQFDLYDGANKHAIEQIISDEIKVENIEIILWHIFNEYNDMHSEIKRLRIANTEMLDSIKKSCTTKDDVIVILNFISSLDEKTNEAINTNETILNIIEKYNLLPCEFCGCFFEQHAGFMFGCLCQPCMYKEMEESNYI